MRDVQFEEVGMKNFGPYIDPMILKFPNNKLTLLTGPNGIGKTMSLDAIPFTLYGITSKKARGDDVVNNRVNKNCKTWVKFSINNDKYKVTRYHKYSKYGNTVVLNQNGVDTKKGHREVTPEIERILCSQKAFMNTLMFGQKIKDFFTDLVDSDKKEIFRKLIGLEQYLDYYKISTDNLKSLMQTEEVLKHSMSVNDSLLSDALKFIESLLNKRDEFEKNKKTQIENMNQSIKENELLRDSWKEELLTLNEELDIDVEATIEELNKVQNEISTIDQEASLKIGNISNQKEAKKLEFESTARKSKEEADEKVKTVIDELKEKQDELKTSLSDLITKNQQERHHLELKSEALSSMNTNLSDRIYEITQNVLEQETSICPTCEQDVSEETKSKLLSKIEDFESQIAKNKEGIENLEKSRKQLTKDLMDESEIINSLIAEVKLEIKQITLNKENEYNQLDIRLQDAITKLNQVEAKQIHKILSEFNSKKVSLEQRRNELTSKKSEQTNNIQKIKEVEDIIKNLDNTIENIKNKIDFKEEEEFDETLLKSYIAKERELEVAISEGKIREQELYKKMAIYDFWKTGFSSTGIPSMLIDDSIPFMNKKIAKYLELLTNGRYIVSFDTLDETKAGEFRDKISVRVVDTQTKANSRVQLSGGQTRIIDIATILTLGDLQSNIQDVKFNILLFDEIFDALDDENANYVSKVLNKLKIDKSIYVISHQHQDHLEPDEILTMR